MVRIVKSPEERRHEFIHAADELFREKGYYGTSIEDIIQRVGVAKGLFYYYFESKEDLVDAMIEHLWEETEEKLDRIVEDEGLTALEKFYLYGASRRESKSHQLHFIEVLQRERDSPLVQKMKEVGIRRTVPVMTRLIEQGVEEGVFDTEYPEEAAEFLIRGSEMVMTGLDGDAEVLARKFAADMDMWERVLGAEKGTFSRFIEEGRELMETISSRMRGYRTGDDETKRTRGE